MYPSICRQDKYSTCTHNVMFYNPVLYLIVYFNPIVSCVDTVLSCVNAILSCAYLKFHFLICISFFSVGDMGTEFAFALRTPELVGLADHFCASFCLYSSKFREKNQIEINLMKHGMCNIHINDYYFKYFV